MKGRILLAVVATFAVMTTAASARTTIRLAHDRGSKAIALTLTLTEAQAAAIQYWGGEPCDGVVNIAYSNVTPAGLPPSLAWAWFVTPAGPMNYTEPPDTFTDCTITINTTYFSPYGQRMDWPLFCAVIVREYGHLFGHDDDYAAPRTSLLNPIVGSANMFTPACVTRYRVFGLSR